MWLGRRRLAEGQAHCFLTDFDLFSMIKFSIPEGLDILLSYRTNIDAL